MPHQDEHFRRNYSRFDAMSTEALKEILRQDALLPDAAGSDMDAILYIMEVIAKREAEDPTEGFTPAEAAWRSFNEHYRTEDCDGGSLYEGWDLEDEDAPDNTVDPSETAKHSKSPKRFRGVLRVACVAAVLIAVLFAGSLTAYALGYDLWGAVAQWTRDTFGFTATVEPREERSIYPADDDPREVLAANGVTGQFLPNWVPDGYQYKDITITKTPARKVFRVVYTNAEDEITVSITQSSDNLTRTYEKDEQNVVTYLANGIDHYIMHNLEKLNVVWMVGNFECLIKGDISIETAQRIIDSIYGS